MSFKKLFVLTLLLFIWPFIACSPDAAPASIREQAELVSAKQKEEAKTQETWEKEWERTLSGAKKEGKVVIYTASVGSALAEALPGFKRKYGFSFEILSGRSSEIAAKIIQERRTGLFLADVFIGGLNTIFGDIKPAGAAEPMEATLLLPEVLDPRAWYGEKLPWADKDHLVFTFYAHPTPMIGINSEQVKRGEIKSYYDLLEPRWKGKILINAPMGPGTAFNGFSNLLYHKVVSLDFFRQLVSQQTQMLRDERLVVEWISKGKYPVALWPHSSPLSEFRQSGAPIDTVEAKEGTYMSAAGGNIVLVNKAPHPNAARVFINWLLSKEGQMMIQNYFQQQSSRADLPTEGLDPLRVRKPGGNYFISTNSIEEWVIKEQEKYLEMAKQIFAPLIK